MPWSKERRKEANAIRPAGTNRLCCVPLCDYNTLAYWRRPGAQSRSMHMFPNDAVRRQQWVENIQRRQPDGMPWEPAEASRVCSIHFSEACFLDRFIARGVKYRGRARVNKRLANFSIPTIFPGYPPDIIVPHQIQAGAKHFTPDMKRTRKRREDNQLLNTPITSFENLVSELRDKIRLGPHWHIYRTGAPPSTPQIEREKNPYALADADETPAEQEQRQQQPQDEQEQDNTLTLTCMNFANLEQPRVCGWIIVDDSLDCIVHVPGSIVLEARLQNIVMSGGRTQRTVATPNGQFKLEDAGEPRLVTWTQLSRLVREIERPVKIEMAEKSQQTVSFYSANNGGLGEQQVYMQQQQDVKPAVQIGSMVNVQGADGQPVSGRIISITSSSMNAVDTNRLTFADFNRAAVAGTHATYRNGDDSYNDEDEEMYEDAGQADDSFQQTEDDSDDEEQHAYEKDAYMHAHQKPSRVCGGNVVNVMAPKREDEHYENLRGFGGHSNGKPIVYKSQRVNLVIGGADEEGDENMDGQLDENC